MKNLYVIRYSFLSVGVFGTIFDDAKIPFAVSLENVETIFDPGIYTAHRDFYHTGKYATFEIEIPGRARILLHKLNWQRQSKGCIGVAESFESLFDKQTGLLLPAVAGSEKGFEEFWTKYKNEEKIRINVAEVAWPFQQLP